MFKGNSICHAVLLGGMCYLLQTWRWSPLHHVPWGWIWDLEIHWHPLLQWWCQDPVSGLTLKMQDPSTPINTAQECGEREYKTWCNTQSSQFQQPRQGTEISISWLLALRSWKDALLRGSKWVSDRTKFNRLCTVQFFWIVNRHRLNHTMHPRSWTQQRIPGTSAMEFPLPSTSS